MLDLAAGYGIASVIETIKADQINDAFDRVVASDVRFRFVIDVNSVR